MSGLYEQFKTDDRLETEGLWLEYGNTRIRVARAGGSNKKYQKKLEAVSRPYRRMLQADMLPQEQGTKLLIEAFLDTVILAWEVRENETQPWVPGVPGPNGTTLEFTWDNVRQVLTDLPDLLDDIREQATKAALFREDLLEADAKN